MADLFMREEHKAKQLYETGTPTPDIASELGRSCSAVLQRAWEKRWPRPNLKQNPTVPNGVSSGLLFGGAGQTPESSVLRRLWRTKRSHWDFLYYSGKCRHFEKLTAFY